MTVGELCRLDIVNVSTGENLGAVDDIMFSPEEASITHVVLYGRLRFFGLLGRDDDVYIPWKDIQKIGKDVLLVDTVLDKNTQTKAKQKAPVFQMG